MSAQDRASNTKRLVWFITLLSLLSISLWMRFFSAANKPGRDWIGFQCLPFILLSFAAAKFLNATFREKKHHYRLSVVLIFVLGLSLYPWENQTLVDASFLNDFFSLFLAVFLGSFIASGTQYGWWENNAPPSHAVEQAVITLHRAHMGTLVTRSKFKRVMDILFSLLTMLISFPLWLFIIILVWFEDPGPVIFIKNSVGRGGANFKQLKFRSMITHAEKETGPISGYEHDERVLWIGKFLRKTALDELPQMINIILGHMSYVGPRPQRTVLVHQYLQKFPRFAARHRVRPGLAGLAQVTDSYHITPEQKLAWDLVYIQNANLWLDFRLALSAFLLVFGLRWSPISEPEKLIRRMLKINKPDI